MIRRCADTDIAAMDPIINEAAQAYRGVIPVDCWHEPYLTRSELATEIAAGVNAKQNGNPQLKNFCGLPRDLGPGLPTGIP
jgi:hypothetical protein